MTRTKIFLGFLLLILGSCAIHQGTMSSNVATLNREMVVLDQISVSTTATRVLLFGGLGKSALVNAAKRKLYARRPLGRGEAYSNVSVDFKRSFVLPFLSRTKVTLSADVVSHGSLPAEAIPAMENYVFDPVDESKLRYNQPLIYFDGDSAKPCFLIKIRKKGQAKVKIMQGGGLVKQTFSTRQLYLAFDESEKEQVFREGEVFKTRFNGQEVACEVEAVGLTFNKVLLRIKDGGKEKWISRSAGLIYR